MTLVETFRAWYEQEREANRKMLEMLGSVPEAQRGDPRYQRALDLAAHLTACRNNWLIRMQGALPTGEWWPTAASPDALAGSIAASEEVWASYLSGLTPEELERDFEFSMRDGRRAKWNVQGQLMQLVGHGYYHRGQIAVLVGELGGEVIDTDYLYWAFETDPRYGFL